MRDLSMMMRMMLMKCPGCGLPWRGATLCAHISSFLFDLEIAILKFYVTFCQIILSIFVRFRYQC